MRSELPRDDFSWPNCASKGSPQFPVNPHLFWLLSEHTVWRVRPGPCAMYTSAGKSLGSQVDGFPPEERWDVAPLAHMALCRCGKHDLMGTSTSACTPMHGGTCAPLAPSPQLCIHSLHSSPFLDCFERGSAAVRLIVNPTHQHYIWNTSFIAVKCANVSYICSLFLLLAKGN